jgi:hypothetical protein
LVPPHPGIAALFVVIAANCIDKEKRTIDLFYTDTADPESGEHVGHYESVRKSNQWS